MSSTTYSQRSTLYSISLSSWTLVGQCCPWPNLDWCQVSPFRRHRSHRQKNGNTPPPLTPIIFHSGSLCSIQYFEKILLTYSVQMDEIILIMINWSLGSCQISNASLRFYVNCKDKESITLFFPIILLLEVFDIIINCSFYFSCPFLENG